MENGDTGKLKIDSETILQAVKTIKAAVCPLCYNHFEWPKVWDAWLDEAGNQIRRYYGWCAKCDRGFEVLQFKKGESWVLHKWKLATYCENGGIVTLNPHWHDVVALPGPQEGLKINKDGSLPCVVTGQGDYQKGYDPEDPVQLCEIINDGMGRLSQLLMKLKRLITEENNS